MKTTMTGAINDLRECWNGWIMTCAARRTVWLPLPIWLAINIIALAQEPSLPDLTRPIVSQKNLVFREIADATLKADMYRPADEQLHPLVLMIHGGAWSAGDKWDMIDHARELAQAGFVAVSINYRLAPKYPIGAQIDDCHFAMRWASEMAEQWQADPTRFALWGYSAGAHLSSLVALKPRSGDPEICAVVAGGAPCEFSFIPEDNPVIAHVMGGTRLEKPEVYRDTSPLVQATESAPPFFFFHGTSDFLVPQSSSKALFEKLQQLSVPAEYFAVEGKGHLFSFVDHDARRQSIAFLNKHLKEKP